MSWLEAYRGRRVLLFGASGFIGRRVARRLASAGALLHTAGRRSGELPTGTPLRADLERPGAAAEAVAAVRPAVTFNLAGYGVDPAEADPALAERLNHTLLRELVQACAEHGERSWAGQALVHAGSAAEYGAAGGDLAEDSEPRPTSLYGRTKLGGTEVVCAAARSGALRAVTARLFTVFGPGERPGRLLPTLVAARQTRGDIPLTTGLQQRDFTYVDDVAEGLLRLGIVPAEGLGPVNLATGRLETVRGFVLRAAPVLGLGPERLRFGALPTRSGEMEHAPVSLGRLSTLLAWRPVTSIEEGVRATLLER